MDGRDKPGHDGAEIWNHGTQDITIATSHPRPSQRALRVGELIRHAIAEMLTRGDVHDPVLEGHVITVPEVRMTPDLRLATIYVMPLGGRDVKRRCSKRSSATSATCAARSRIAST